MGAARHELGSAIAERLAKDIPGVVRVEWMANSAHLPMLEEPRAYGEALIRFFAEDDLPPHKDTAGANHSGERRQGHG